MIAASIKSLKIIPKKILIMIIIIIIPFCWIMNKNGSRWNKMRLLRITKLTTGKKKSICNKMSNKKMGLNG